MSKDTKTQLKKLLGDFSQSKGSLLSGIHSGFYQYSVSKSYEKWRLARFLFDEILNFEIADRPIEKVNWEIPFIYKKRYHCSIAHQKFGFRVYIANEDTRNPKTIAEEITEIIEKGLEYSEPIIRKYAIDSLTIGDINVDNRLCELKEVYEYFRDEVSKRKRKIENISKVKGKSKDFQEQFELEKEVSYLEQAGYVAFLAY